ncbi:MAG: PspA-associated protein PspAA [Nocardioidaceae bacterium]
MIIRILSEGQFDVPDTELDALNVLDERLESSVEAADEDKFRRSLDELLAKVRSDGSPVAVDALTPSDLVLPQADASLTEVRELLTDDGLIPGRSDASTTEGAGA